MFPFLIITSLSHYNPLIKYLLFTLGAGHHGLGPQSPSWAALLHKIGYGQPLIVPPLLTLGGPLDGKLIKISAS